MAMQDHIREVLAGIGEDPDREGLLKTPERVEKALKFLTRGYTQDPKSLLNDALFSVRDSRPASECNRHASGSSNFGTRRASGSRLAGRPRRHESSSSHAGLAGRSLMRGR